MPQETTVHGSKDTEASVRLFLLGTFNGSLPAYSALGENFHVWAGHVTKERGLDDRLSGEIGTVRQNRTVGHVSEVVPSMAMGDLPAALPTKLALHEDIWS